MAHGLPAPQPCVPPAIRRVDHEADRHPDGEAAPRPWVIRYTHGAAETTMESTVTTPSGVWIARGRSRDGRFVSSPEVETASKPMSAKNTSAAASTVPLNPWLK